jgi:hypothetical protein
MLIIVELMLNSDEDDSMYVNWWDNPTNPDSWHKHQVRAAAVADGVLLTQHGRTCTARLGLLHVQFSQSAVAGRSC